MLRAVGYALMAGGPIHVVTEIIKAILHKHRVENVDTLGGLAVGIAGICILAYGELILVVFAIEATTRRLHGAIGSQQERGSEQSS